MSHTVYDQIISIEHLLQAWEDFRIGKRKRKDVQEFERNLEDNLFQLHYSLKAKIYQHGSYTHFNIYDPKFRHIHKACVIDRVVHHAIVSVIEEIFDRTFIYDSYSCRKNKGTHRGVKRLYVFVRKVSRNYTRTCFALKMDVKKFFASVDHDILLSLIKKKIGDADLIWLLENILKSFTREKGIPIGNLTSQIFANIYLNELDQFVKHELSVRYYLRYADDFLILDSDREVLGSVQMKIEGFLKDYLKLELHPNKTIIRRYTQGIDFLGYIVLPHYILPRTKTKRRIFQKMREKKLEMKIGVVSKESFHQSLQSYLGFLKHASAHRLTKELKLSL